MRSTFNILFYVNKSKEKNGVVPVMGRVTINGPIWQRCMWLKGVVLTAHYNGKIPRNPFAQFHISPNCKEREFLTEEELKAVVTHEFEDDNLAFVRDIFVFVCFTALSFIDKKNLTTDNIVGINGDKWIICKRHKTNIPFQVKLMDVPLQIIDRYKHLQEGKLVFGKMRSTFGRLARPRTTGQCARS